MLAPCWFLSSLVFKTTRPNRVGRAGQGWAQWSALVVTGMLLSVEAREGRRRGRPSPATSASSIRPMARRRTVRSGVHRRPRRRDHPRRACSEGQRVHQLTLMWEQVVLGGLVNGLCRSLGGGDDVFAGLSWQWHTGRSIGYERSTGLKPGNGAGVADLRIVLPRQGDGLNEHTLEGLAGFFVGRCCFPWSDVGLIGGLNGGHGSLDFCAKFTRRQCGDGRVDLGLVGDLILTENACEDGGRRWVYVP